MYLFEAIKLGAMSKPQGFGTLASAYKNDTLCAFGAAKFACGIDSFGMSGLYTKFPVCRVDVDQKSIPKLPNASHDVLNVIWQLNDCAKWTREQIAQWLEPIELAYYDAHPEERPVDVVVENVNTTQELVHV